MKADRTIVLRVAGVLISVLCVALLLRSVDVAESARLLGSIDIAPLALVGLALAVQLTLRTFRWRLLLPIAPGAERPAVVRVLVVLPIGYLGNAVLPARLGEPLRAYLLARREGLDAVAVFGSVVLERVVDTATLAMVAFAAAASVGGPAWLTQGAALVAAACVALFVVAGVASIADPEVARRMMAELRQSRFNGFVLRAEAFGAGLRAGRDPERLIVAALVSASCWMLDASIFWLCGRALGIDLSIQAAVLIAAVTVLGTALPSAPGYVGTFELAAAGVAGLLGVPPSSALALALLAHVVAVLPVALVGGVALAIIGGNFGETLQRAQAVR